MRKVVFLIIFVLIQENINAQVLDSLQITAGSTLTVAEQEYLPLWLVSNRFGEISDQKYDFSTYLSIKNTYLGSFRDQETYSIDYGLNLINNNHFKTCTLQEVFIAVSYNNMQLSAGRIKEIKGEIDKDLSSGALGISGNALPIPKLTFSIPNYINVPFTNGFAQFKGQLSHGWMGKEQFMKGSMLHEKNFYLRFGKKKFKLYGDIQHYAVWGGSRPNDRVFLDRSFNGFLDVLFANEANDGSVPGNILPNRAGDHRGVLEFGAEWENDKIKIQLNNQTPFEMGQGITPQNIDRLISLNIYNKNKSFKLKKVVVELLYTKQMNDFYAMKYRESYYNNGVYKTGWEYENHIIGTPLFINRTRASKYFNSIQPYNWDSSGKEIGMDNIINNRVVGVHLGSVVELSNQVSYKAMLTYTKNYGNYDLTEFTPSKSQFYNLHEINWIIPKSKLSLKGSLAYDFGELSNNIGSMLGLQWQLY